VFIRHKNDLITLLQNYRYRKTKGILNRALSRNNKYKALQKYKTINNNNNNNDDKTTAPKISLSFANVD